MNNLNDKELIIEHDKLIDDHSAIFKDETHQKKGQIDKDIDEKETSRFENREIDFHLAMSEINHKRKQS